MNYISDFVCDELRNFMYHIVILLIEKCSNNLGTILHNQVFIHKNVTVMNISYNYNAILFDGVEYNPEPTLDSLTLPRLVGNRIHIGFDRPLGNQISNDSARIFVDERWQREPQIL